MKRIAALVLAFSLLCGGMAFAAGPGGMTGIGVFGSYGFSTGGGGAGGVGLSLKFGSFPVLGIKYNIAQNGYLGASCDWYVVDSAGLADSLCYFIGVGGYGGVYFGNELTGDFGIRIPIGLQLWILKKIELFLAVVPGIPLLPTPALGLGAELGFRVHF